MGSLWKCVSCLGNECSHFGPVAVLAENNIVLCTKIRLSARQKLGYKVKWIFHILGGFERFLQIYNEPLNVKNEGPFFTYLNAYIYKTIHALQKHTGIHCIARNSTATGAKLT